MPRIALGLEYEGTDIAGWQAQANARSVQAELARAVSNVADHAVTVHAAGRTDAGVHALGQVVHFDSGALRSPEQWLLGINSGLPEDIAVRWVHAVAGDFDARRSAQWRRYVYLIQHGPVRAALARRYAWWVRRRVSRGRLSVADTDALPVSRRRGRTGRFRSAGIHRQRLPLPYGPQLRGHTRADRSAAPAGRLGGRGARGA
jgi:tRNA pseudouridine38-40 synthase